MEKQQREMREEFFNFYNSNLENFSEKTIPKDVENIYIFAIEEEKDGAKYYNPCATPFGIYFELSKEAAVQTLESFRAMAPVMALPKFMNEVNSFMDRAVVVEISPNDFTRIQNAFENWKKEICDSLFFANQALRNLNMPETKPFHAMLEDQGYGIKAREEFGEVRLEIIRIGKDFKKSAPLLTKAVINGEQITHSIPDDQDDDQAWGNETEKASDYLNYSEDDQEYDDDDSWGEESDVFDEIS